MSGEMFVWDTSGWDYDRGPVDVAAGVRDGIGAVTAKATEGRSFVDPHYADTAARARGVAPLFGAYHVLHPASVSPISDQVNWHLLTLNVRSPWWRSGPWLVQLDCERWAANDFPTAADIQLWCDLFRARTGAQYTPLVYASRGQYGDTLSRIDCPLWNADYGTNPVVHYRQAYQGDGWRGWAPYSGRTAVLGQYGSRLTVGGQPGCDVSAFRGALTQLIALASGGGTMQWNDPNIPKLLNPADPRVYATPDPILVDLLAFLDGRPSFYNPAQRPPVGAQLQRIEDALTALQARPAAAVTLSPADLQTIIDGVLRGLGAAAKAAAGVLDAPPPAA